MTGGRGGENPWEGLDLRSEAPFQSSQELDSHLLLWVDALLDCAQEEGKQSADFFRARRETLQGLYPTIHQRSNQGDLQKPDFLPFFRVCHQFSLDQGGVLALALCYVLELDPDYGLVFGQLQGRPGTALPDLYLITQLFTYLSDEPSQNLQDLKNPYSFLSCTLFPHSRKGGLELPLQVLLWIQGHQGLYGGLADCSQLLPPPRGPLLLYQDHLRALSRLVLSLPPQLLGLPPILSAGPTQVVQLQGKPGSGRRFLLAHLAQEEGRQILSLDLGQLETYPQAQQQALFWQICLELTLQNALLHLVGCQPETTPKFCQSLPPQIPLVFLSSQELIPLPPSLAVTTLTLPELSISQRLTLWQGQEVPFAQDVDFGQCASSYQLTPGQISQICQQAWQRAKFHGKSQLNQEILVEQVHLQRSQGLEQLAKEVPVHYTWEDLILPEAHKEVLQMAKNRLLLQGQVDETWGFGKKFAYGSGLSLLFCGASGTGKTMAAQVMAKETGRSLFAADLSRLSSKYIGESEKNVAELFDVARDSNAILFFDEADALFARRTEVENSNDRYANATVAFLLQQMEQYPGMCILATNLLQNFDTAFLRRITFVIRFQKPDFPLRLAIWQSAFPEEAPLLPDLDLAFFAQELELSGSSIKSVARNAAFFAAQEGGAIGTSHLVQALKLDYQKTSPLSLPQCLTQLIDP